MNDYTVSDLTISTPEILDEAGENELALDAGSEIAWDFFCEYEDRVEEFNEALSSDVFDREGWKYESSIRILKNAITEGYMDCVRRSASQCRHDEAIDSYLEGRGWNPNEMRAIGDGLAQVLLDFHWNDSGEMPWSYEQAYSTEDDVVDIVLPLLSLLPED